MEIRIEVKVSLFTEYKTVYIKKKIPNTLPGNVYTYKHF